MVLIEFKCIQIDFLDIPPAEPPAGRTKSVRVLKAQTLENMSDIKAILQLKFAPYDTCHPAGDTIEKWIPTQIPQLTNYWNGSTFKELRNKYKAVAYFVLIIGSRKILVSQLSNDGESLGEYHLVGELDPPDFT